MSCLCWKKTMFPIFTSNINMRKERTINFFFSITSVVNLFKTFILFYEVVPSQFLLILQG